MTRTTIAALPYTSNVYCLYDMMALITHLSPSFHPMPTNQVVYIKVDADKAEEAKTLIKQADANAKQ